MDGGKLSSAFFYRNIFEMGNVMGKAYTYKKTIKRAACVMLAAGLVFTGCPKVFLSQSILKVHAAQGYESLVKSCIDNINTFDADDENTYLTEIINGLESDEACSCLVSAFRTKRGLGRLFPNLYEPIGESGHSRGRTLAHRLFREAAGCADPG